MDESAFSRTKYNVLVVEDNDGKSFDIERVIESSTNSLVTIVRASTLIGAERFINDRAWDLVLLDVSMDIATSTVGLRSGGHDPIGGLRVAQKMFLLGNEAPTIIVTAFDAFPREDGIRSKTEILDLENVREKASEVLGSYFRGCVRYGDLEWKRELSELVEKILK